jgi:phage-related tail fiber protein
MQFKTIHTTYGLQRMAAAEAAGTVINITHMAVGDGNGNPVSPYEGQTALVGEKYRTTVNRVFQDPVDPKKYTAEMIVPATEGGFTMREIAAFDADGGMFVVGNLPASYKPHISEGAFGDIAVRIEFLVTNSGIVTIMIDPNVTVATQAWISNNITAANLIPGGTVNQLLAKDSNADGDFKWVDPDNVNVTVQIIEERQTLVNPQTTVTLATTTTTSLAVYIEGVRLSKGAGADQWQPLGGTSLTQITLGQSYPDGSEILLVQNDPAGAADAPLLRGQNLADLENAATARTNLDVFNKSETRQMAPAGMVAHFPRSTAPAGWLKANGAAISRTAYADLYAVLGTAYGTGDGFTTFNLPDLRGEFLRGWDDARGIDAGRTLGSAQTDQNKAHGHSASTDVSGGHSHSYVDTDTEVTSGSLQTGSGWQIQDRQTTYQTGSAGDHSHGVTVSSSGGNEARPRNVAMLACIKF